MGQVSPVELGLETWCGLEIGRLVDTHRRKCKADNTYRWLCDKHAEMRGRQGI